MEGSDAGRKSGAAVGPVAVNGMVEGGKAGRGEGQQLSETCYYTQRDLWDNTGQCVKNGSRIPREMPVCGQNKEEWLGLGYVGCASFGERGSVDELLLLAGPGEEAQEEVDLGPQ